MYRIKNISTGEIIYIDIGAPIPDGWISYPYTIYSSVESAGLRSWLWLIAILIILALALNRGKLWIR
jgi:hypothetical protein